MELKGRVALVTGGNGGLGQRICHALARAGCDVAVVYARSQGDAEKIARDLACIFHRNVFPRGSVPHEVRNGAFDDLKGTFQRLFSVSQDCRQSIPLPDMGGEPDLCHHGGQPLLICLSAV